MPQKEFHFLRPQANWQSLYFYQKTVALYQLTYAFTKRYLGYTDRTIDQMVQAARSGKQNIVEGSTDGVTSTEIEVRLMNVARGSVKELREDYEDYIATRHLVQWKQGHPRFDPLLDFCRHHNKAEDYTPFLDNMNDEELANLALTLCHFIDKMMTKHLTKLEHDFVEEGGIRERMTAARLGRRQTQNQEITALKARVAELEAEVNKWRTWYAEQKKAGKL
ncbi:MAG: four helix bundle suffix domain-containing protein [Bacteroidaceae bacterium]|nr:four helix bundle suffix domain-containing protein [Bacteroidaceae bacterium]